MIGFYDYTVLATYAATALGVTGMFQAVEGRHLTAVFCLLAAGLLDCFDGRIARTKKDRSHQQQSFGIQIDSLNDVLCFGALPSVAGYCAWSRWSDAPTPVWYGAALCVFTLAGLIRLAYFNVTEEERQQTEGGGRKYYLGLPITASALVFPLFYLLGLRLHLSAIGHPLLGDWLYGTEDRTLIPRPALHSHRLELTHPVTRRRLTVTAPLPEDMARLLPEDMNKS